MTQRKFEFGKPNWVGGTIPTSFRVEEQREHDLLPIQLSFVWGILMNLSFLPGDLHLSKSSNGQFVLRMAGREILSTKSQRAAVAKFNAIRSDLETKFPARQPTREEKAKLLEREIKDSPGQKSSGKAKKKKALAGRSQTPRG